MRHRSLFWVFTFVALLSFYPATTQAQTCADCETAIGGDWSLLSQKLDFNSNGFSTYDLLVVRKIQLYSGLNVATVSSLSGLMANEVDVTGDGLYTVGDYFRINKLKQFLIAAGLSSLDLDVFHDCARRYILNICN